MGVVIIERRADHYAMMRSVKLLCDGVELASLKRGEQVTLEVPDGGHFFRAVIDWAGSPEVHALVTRDRPLRGVMSFSAGASWKSFFKPSDVIDLLIE